ncbi:MAG: ABC transporter permease [Bacteroidaceae bacterium]|nr:ABC transporter permease [Bacteroidaceae bacterium]
MRIKESRAYAITRRELTRMIRRPVYLLCMICAPLFCFVFFTTLMGNGLPEDLPAGVVDCDNSSISRMVIRNLDAFQQTDLRYHYASFAEAREAMQSGKIYGFYYIPKGLSHDTQRFEQAKVSFYTNATYLVPASLLYQDMTKMSEYASAGVSRETLLAKGYTMDQAMGFLQPIQIDMRAVHNPMLNYSIYLSNTLLPGVLALIIMLVTVFSVHTELKDGTAGEWLDMADDNIYLAVFGKILPQTLVFMLMSMVYLVWLYGINSYPLNSGIWPMILASFLLVLALQGFALFICSAVPSLRWSLSLCTLWGVLSFPISGLSFPVMGMPPAIQALSNLFPLRQYYLIYVDQALNGLPLHYSAAPYLALVSFIVLPLVDVWLLKRTARQYVYLY